MDPTVLAALEEINAKVDRLSLVQNPTAQIQSSRSFDSKEDLKMELRRKRMEHQETLSRLEDTESKLQDVRKDFEEYKAKNDAKLESMEQRMTLMSLDIASQDRAPLSSGDSAAPPAQDSCSRVMEPKELSDAQDIESIGSDALSDSDLSFCEDPELVSSKPKELVTQAQSSLGSSSEAKLQASSVSEPKAEDDLYRPYSFASPPTKPKDPAIQTQDSLGLGSGFCSGLRSRLAVSRAEPLTFPKDDQDIASILRAVEFYDKDEDRFDSKPRITHQTLDDSFDLNTEAQSSTTQAESSNNEVENLLRLRIGDLEGALASKTRQISDMEQKHLETVCELNLNSKSKSQALEQANSKIKELEEMVINLCKQNLTTESQKVSSELISKPKGSSGSMAESKNEPKLTSKPMDFSGSTTKSQLTSELAPKPESSSGSMAKPKPSSKPKDSSDFEKPRPFCLDDSIRMEELVYKLQKELSLTTVDRAAIRQIQYDIFDLFDKSLVIHSKSQITPAEDLRTQIAELQSELQTKNREISEMERDHEEILRNMTEQLDDARAELEHRSPTQISVLDQDEIKDARIEALEERIAELQMVIQASVDQEQPTIAPRLIAPLTPPTQTLRSCNDISTIYDLRQEVRQLKELLDGDSTALVDVNSNLRSRFYGLEVEVESLKGQVQKLTEERSILKSLMRNETEERVKNEKEVKKLKGLLSAAHVRAFEKEFDD